jgi:hypothetical protein
MALAKRGVIEVVSTKEEMCVHLTLTPEEAQLLSNLTNHIGGNGHNRRVLCGIGEALKLMGIPYGTLPMTDDSRSFYLT